MPEKVVDTQRPNHRDVECPKCHFKSSAPKTASSWECPECEAAREIEATEKEPEPEEERPKKWRVHYVLKAWGSVVIEAETEAAAVQALHDHEYDQLLNEADNVDVENGEVEAS